MRQTCKGSLKWFVQGSCGRRSERHGKGDERQERLKHVIITIGAVVSIKELLLFNSSLFKPPKLFRGLLTLSLVQRAVKDSINVGYGGLLVQQSQQQLN
jgi:hypothetical protein